MRSPIEMEPTRRGVYPEERRSNCLRVPAPLSPRVSPTVALVTAGDPGRLTGGNLYKRHMLETLLAAGLSSFQLSLPGRPYPLKVAALRSALIRQKPSLVVVDSLALGVAAPLAPWIKEQLGASLVVLMHRMPSDLAPVWQRPLTRRLESRLLQAADCTVAVSPFIRSRLIAAGAAAEKTVVVAPGRDSVPATNGSPNGHLKDRFRFLCVANWSPNKRIHLVVEAAARLDARVQLDLVGEGHDRRYARRIFDLLRRSGAARRVHIYGPLEGEALARRYLSADAFVLPSRSEGFGTVYAEAMSFGLPVIACRVGPLPWLVEQGCGVLLPPDDVDALTEAMQTLSGHPAMPRRMGEAALLRALRLPTWRDSEKRFLSLVEGLLG